jgi:hypothetical protein
MSRYSDLVQAQGATHHWSFDEPGAPFLDTVGTMHMDIVDGSASDVDGVVNKAVGLGGGTAIRQLGPESTVQFVNTQGFSYSAIALYNSFSVNGAIVGRRQNGTTARTFGMFVFNSGTGSGLTTDIGGNQIRWTTGFYPPIGEYCHYAYAYDPATNTGQLWINGQLLATNNYASTPNNSSGSAYVMVGGLQNSSDGSSSSNINGRIDDIAIFQNKTLTDAEVLAQYATAFPIMRVLNGDGTWTDADRRVIS